MNINTANYWNEKWSSQHEYYRFSPERDHVYSEILSNTPPGRFLDLGGGVSRLAHIAKGRGYTPVVVDLSETAVDMLKMDGIEAHVRNLEILEIEPVVGQFEFVTATEIIEHLDHPEYLMYFASRHADRMFISAPTHEAPPFADHVRTYDMESLSRFLSCYWQFIAITKLDRDYLIAEVNHWLGK